MEDCKVISTYSFGMPGYVIWGGHIAFGILLLVLSGIAIKNFTGPDEEDNLEKHDVNNYHIGFGIFFIVVASFAIGYHSHIWYLEYSKKTTPTVSIFPDI